MVRRPEAVELKEEIEACEVEPVCREDSERFDAVRVSVRVVSVDCVRCGGARALVGTAAAVIVVKVSPVVGVSG
jgi:hypothetical protein